MLIGTNSEPDIMTSSDEDDEFSENRDLELLEYVMNNVFSGNCVFNETSGHYIYFRIPNENDQKYFKRKISYKSRNLNGRTVKLRARSHLEEVLIIFHIMFPQIPLSSNILGRAEKSVIR